MNTLTLNLCPSAPLENNDSQQRIEKILKVENSFENSLNNIKERIIYFKDRNHKSKKNKKNYKYLTTKLKSVDIFGIIATTTSSITLSLTKIGLIVIPIATGTAYGFSISDKVFYEIVMPKYNNKYRNTIKTINKQLNFLINYLEKVYKIL